MLSHCRTPWRIGGDTNPIAARFFTPRWFVSPFFWDHIARWLPTNSSQWGYLSRVFPFLDHFSTILRPFFNLFPLEAQGFPAMPAPAVRWRERARGLSDGERQVEVTPLVWSPRPSHRWGWGKPGTPKREYAEVAPKACLCGNMWELFVTFQLFSIRFRTEIRCKVIVCPFTSSVKVGSMVVVRPPMCQGVQPTRIGDWNQQKLRNSLDLKKRSGDVANYHCVFLIADSRFLLSNLRSFRHSPSK